MDKEKIKTNIIIQALNRNDKDSNAFIENLIYELELADKELNYPNALKNVV